MKLVIVGAGGHGREILDLALAVDNAAQAGHPGADRVEIVGVLDDGHPDLVKLAAYDVPHLGPISEFSSLPADVQYVAAIGAPAARRFVNDRLGSSRAARLVHPTVTMGRAVEVGPGSVICAQSSLTNHIRLGAHVHINRGCTIGHDVVVDDFVTLSPLVGLSGAVRVQRGAFLGTGAVVNPLLTIGEGATIGSGAAVIKDVAANVTAVGVPAKPR